MMLHRFLDPKNDVAFKKIFGSEKNKDIVIHFLNDMITFKKQGKIVSVTFLKTEQDPETIAKKTSLVDVLCKDEKGNIYIVEMQMAKEKGFEKRAQYYASKAYISQAHKRGKYHQLKEVIFLAISNFIMFPRKKAYKSDHVILDKEELTNDLKDFSFTFLELPKFDKDINHLETMTEKWAYFFKNAEETSEDDLAKIIEGDEVMKRAFSELNRFSWSDEELLIYDQAEKYESAYLASMEQRYDEGVAEGEKLGLVKGENQGVAKAQLTIAEKMLKMGQPKPLVSKMTGLPLAEVRKIAKDLKIARGSS
ncbi:MAG: Rpn family recombination-promoting nuclease/putative transposase [Chlamydiales bacterium]